MKKQIHLIVLFLIMGMTGKLLSQPQIVDNLCYETELTKRISIATGVDLNTLTILDKLKFKKKNYVKKQHEYINVSGNATRDIHFVSHENMFPKWYSHPSTIRIDGSGTKSFFNTQNKCQTDGWTGGAITTTQHGEYITDAKSGERYLYMPYSNSASEEYYKWNDEVIANGFLFKYVIRTFKSRCIF